MVEALGFQSDGCFLVQLSDGSTISIPEEDLVGLARVCSWADLHDRPAPENPYGCVCCERGQAVASEPERMVKNVFGDAALDAHVREITGENEE